MCKLKPQVIIKLKNKIIFFFLLMFGCLSNILNEFNIS